MKKLFYSFLLLLIWTVLVSPTTYVQSSDDEFWDFSVSIWEEYDDGEDNPRWNRTISNKLDFFWTRLLNNALTYLFYYPKCFTTKGIWEMTIIYAKPTFCYPKWANKNAEKIQISELLSAQNLMDWNYKIKNRTFLILIPLLIIVWLIAYVLIRKNKIQKWNNLENTWENSIEKESKNKISFTKKHIIISLLLLLVFWNILSFALDCSIRKHLSEWLIWDLVWDWALYWIWILYLLAFLVFFGLVFIFIKYLLLPFITRKTENKWKDTLYLNISKSVLITIAILVVVWLVVSIFWAWII